VTSFLMPICAFCQNLLAGTSAPSARVMLASAAGKALDGRGFRYRDEASSDRLQPPVEQKSRNLSATAELVAQRNPRADRLKDNSSPLPRELARR
jgi:hypothetical protein